MLWAVNDDNEGMYTLGGDEGVEFKALLSVLVCGREHLPAAAAAAAGVLAR